MLKTLRETEEVAGEQQDNPTAIERQGCYGRGPDVTSNATFIQVSVDPCRLLFLFARLVSCRETSILGAQKTFPTRYPRPLIRAVPNKLPHDLIQLHFMFLADTEEDVLAISQA